MGSVYEEELKKAINTFVWTWAEGGTTLDRAEATAVLIFEAMITTNTTEDVSQARLKAIEKILSGDCGDIPPYQYEKLMKALKGE